VADTSAPAGETNVGEGQQPDPLDPNLDERTRRRNASFLELGARKAGLAFTLRDRSKPLQDSIDAYRREVEYAMEEQGAREDVGIALNAFDEIVKELLAQEPKPKGKEEDPKTKTAAFKNWFKKSKVVDADGKPMEVYHGTYKQEFSDENPEGGAFTTFDSFVNWFSTDSDVSDAYAGFTHTSMVYPVYLSIQNPLKVTQDANVRVGASTLKLLSKLGLKPDEFDFGDGVGKLDQVPVWRLINNRLFLQTAAEKGYDGIEMNERGYKTFAAFSPTQIKSLYNKGTYKQDSEIFTEQVSKPQEDIIVNSNGAFLKPKNPRGFPEASAAFRTLTEADDAYDDVGEAVFITGMDVNPKERGKGTGSRLLYKITEWADKKNKRLALMPAASGGLSQKQLIEWYKRNGFREVGDYLVREPESQTDQAYDWKKYGDPDPKESAEIEAALTGTTAIGAARWLSKNAPTAADREIAKSIINMLTRLQNSGITFSFNIAHTGDITPIQLHDARGLTKTKADSVEVWLNGADLKGFVGVSYETALHELLHAATVGTIHVGERSPPGSHFNNVYKDLVKIHNAIIAHWNQRYVAIQKGAAPKFEFETILKSGLTNAFANERETVTWGMTNPEARDYLESIPYMGGSIWSKFVSTIRTMLGLPAKANTALSELLRVTDVLLQTSAADLINESQKAGLTITGYDLQKNPRAVEDEIISEQRSRPTAANPQEATEQAVEDPIRFMRKAAQGSPTLVTAGEIVRKGALSLRPMWDIAKEAADMGFRQIKTVEEQLRRAGARKEMLDRRNDAFIESMSKFAKENPAAYKRMAEFMNAASRQRMDVRDSDTPPTEYSVEDKAIYRTLRREWEALVPAAKTMSNAFINQYKQFRNEYFVALKQSIRDQYVDDPVRTARVIAAMEQKYNSYNPYYIPFVRVGEYWVNYTDPTNGEETSEAYETLSEQARRVVELKNRGIDTTAFKQVDFKKYSYKSGPVNQFFEEVKKDIMRAIPTYADMTAEERANTVEMREDLLERLYQSSLLLHPESSLLRQFEMQRKGVLGFIEDPLRAFSIKSQSYASQIAQIAHKGKIEWALQDARVKNRKNPNPAMSTIITHVADMIYAKDTTDADAMFNKAANNINRLGFVWYMGFSPASAAANLLQTPMVGYPVLAGRFRNPVKSLSVLTNAFLEVVGSGADVKTFGERFVAAAEAKIAQGRDVNSLPEMERLFYEIDRAGVMNAGSPMHDLDIVSKYGAEGGSKVEKGLHAATKMAGVMFQRAEAINREATALAAYRLAKARMSSGGALNNAQFKNAVRIAGEVVTEAHGDYQHGLAPKVFLDPKIRTLLMFKKFPAHMAAVYMRLFREMFDKADPEVRKTARIQFTGMMGMSAIFSGVVGMPFYYIVRDLCNMLLGDDDDPYDFDYEMYIYLYENLGGDWANRITRGWIGDFGADIGTRVSYESSPLLGGSKQLPFIGGLLGLRDPKNNPSAEATMKDFIVEAIGPLAGMPLQVARGIDKFQQGDIRRFLEGITPLAGVRNVLKAIRMNEEGALTSRGDPIISDLTEAEIAMQALGLTPQRLSSQYRLNAQKKDIQAKVEERKQSLINQYFSATLRNDTKRAEQLVKDMHEFNLANPYKGVAITGETLRASAKTRAKQRAQSQGGVYIPKQFKPMFSDAPIFAEPEE
jgi:GNAT superfamily N-acetyltransferase